LLSKQMLRYDSTLLKYVDRYSFIFKEQNIADAVWKKVNEEN